MALDSAALKAVDKLLANRSCLADLASIGRPQSRTNLKNFLDNNCDAEREDYDEIIDTAANRAIGKAPPPPVPSSSGQQQQRRDGAKDAPTKRTPFDPAKVSAPYRFIDLPDEVVMPETDEPVPLDVPLDGYFCGEIKYELVAESPILIGGASSGRARPGENPPVEPLVLGAPGKFAIPGATMRGMIRAACEIIGHAKLARGNWHHRYGLRDFTHRVYKEQSVSKVDQVKSGFLTIRAATDKDAPAIVVHDGGEALVYELTPCRRDWAHVPITKLNGVGINAPIGDQYAPRDLWTALELNEKYRRAGMISGGRPVFTKTYRFAPSAETFYKGHEMSPLAGGGEEGVLVFAGKFPGKGNKKVEYVFFPDPHGTAVPINADRAALFNTLNSTPSKNRPEPTANWKLMREAARHGGIPVFYVGDPAAGRQDFFFGLTRLFKIPHLKSVGEVLASTQKNHIPAGETRKRESDGKKVMSRYCDDFVERLFGYVVEPMDIWPDLDSESTAPEGIARKGRAAFGFAMLDAKTPARIAEPATVIQMAPRASFSPFYLRSDAKENFEKDYSVPGMRLAGRKAYFPRFPQANAPEALAAIRAAGKRQTDAVPNATNTYSHLKFLLPAGAAKPRFKGTIRLHNVSPAEIGLILFALTHGGSEKGRFRHMVGRGKPFGAGQMRLDALTLTLEANGKDMGLLQPAPEGGHSIGPFLDELDKHMRKTIKAFPAVAPVEEWLCVCDPQYSPPEESAAYLPLSSFQEVRKMFQPLPPGSQPPEKKPRLLAPRRTPLKK